MILLDRIILLLFSNRLDGSVAGSYMRQWAQAITTRPVELQNEIWF